MAQSKEDKSRKFKERALWYESRYICNRCGQAEATPGRKTCQTCRANNKQSWESHDPDHIRTTVNRKALRDARIAAGLCHGCGAPAAPGRRMCERCLMARRDSSRKQRIKKRIEREAQEARERSRA